MMKIPDRATAEALLYAGGRLNPGPWVQHSIYVAQAAEAIARATPDLDGEASYVLGCLHDIGRRFGVTGMRHVLDGYRYLCDLGYDTAARVSLTHSYALQDPRAVFGAMDCTSEELDELERTLAQIEYDDYDRLMQLCDGLAMASGFVLIEKRLVDVLMRYGCNELVVPKWRAILALRTYFDRRTGGSIYDLLPGVVANTFAPADAREG